MKPRIAARDGATRLFAHRGAAAAAPENTIEAFLLAIQLGADGVATEAWRTADGQVVLDRAGSTGGRLRRRRFGSLDRNEIGDHVPSIDDLYDVIAGSADVSIDVRAVEAFEPIVAAARRVEGDVEHRLWLRHGDVDVLTDWRRQCDAKLVLARPAGRLDGPERLANELRERGIDGLSLPHGGWHGGLVALVHRFDRYALATDLVHEREMAKLLDVGIDGITSAQVDRMIAVAAQFA